jgi:hypothetical protein
MAYHHSSRPKPQRATSARVRVTGDVGRAKHEPFEQRCLILHERLPEIARQVSVDFF